QLTHDNNDGLPGRLDAREAYPNYDWGAIRIWAWGHQKLADYLITREDVDAGRLVATGHSRGGKTALAAALFDERFAACCANNSGAGGCGCFRYLGDRNGLNQDDGVVESMGRVGSAFPHWWGPGFKAFEGEERPDAMGRENELPFDLHTLKALIAPRALMSCEGLDDSWANPFGSWLTWKAAQPAFDLLGGRSYIYYREGGHGFGEEDWLAVADFCDELFFGKHTARAWNARDFSD
ncbi:MAG: prolyl oligopeptidase family serine peptidase, partial [Oscillospiraceae bacterium]|nr:prolyl oligopeptidase family serine peptidase [Oscillospiraceae bacterium]